MEFSFNKQSDNIGIYQLKGNLIGETDGVPITESFSEQLDGGTRQFIIDLSELQHINSSGLGVLITLLTKARKVGGEVMLSSPSSYIKNLLLITKLNTIFTIHDTTDVAVNELVKE
ncbi:MAG: STAS domain-containing protein [Bacteroidota bacterium]